MNGQVKNSIESTPISFIAFFGNVDASIQGVGLGNGFSIGQCSTDECLSLLSKLENIPTPMALTHLLDSTNCLNREEGKCYYVRSELGTCGTEETEIAKMVESFDYSMVQDYLDHRIRMMRLFKLGNVCLPLKYYFQEDENGDVRNCGYGGKMSTVIKDPYTLEHQELDELRMFLKATPVVIHHEYVQRSIAQYDVAYQTHKKNLVFQLLLNVVEYLTAYEIDTRDNETVSRSIAILLGSDRDRSRNIERDLNQLFRKQRKLTIMGESSLIEHMDVMKARVYAMESIKEVLSMNIPKKELVRILGKCGHGQRPWRRNSI